MAIRQDLKNKRIIVVLQHVIHVRNFVGSGFLDKLSQTARLCIILPKQYAGNISAGLNKDIEVGFIEDYQGGKLKAWFFDAAIIASLTQRRNLNKTYNKKFASFLKDRRLVLKALLFWIACHFFDLERVAKWLSSKFKVNDNSLSLVERFKPDIVFSPTLIFETLDFEIIKAARQKGAKIIFFVDSWDNLTSKGFFLTKPDLVFVWGQADKVSALKEHDFKEEEVVVTGSAHFDLYFQEENTQEKSSFLGGRGIDSGKKIILFAGTTFRKYANEPLMLKKISDYFKDRKDILFWYRPHPRSIRWDSLMDAKTLPNVYVDDQIIDNFKRTKSGLSVENEYLKHYPRLINSCSGVVSIFSTMVIEFALLKKPSILIDFIFDDKGRESCDEKYRLSVYAHLQDVLKWEGVFIAGDFNSLCCNIGKLAAGEFEKFGPVLQESANRISCNIDGNAQERILESLIR